MREVISPAKGRLVLRPDRPPEKIGSIHLPAAHAGPVFWGKLLDFADDVREALGFGPAGTCGELCVGDTVACEFGAGSPFTLRDGQGSYQVVVVKAEDVVGVVREE